MGFGCESQAGNQRADGWTSRAKSCEEKRGQIKFIIILWVWGQITADTSRCSPGIFVLAVMHFLFVCSWTLLFWEDPTPKTFQLPLPELRWVAHRHHDAFKWLLINPKSSYCYTQVLERQFNRFAHTLICDSSEQFIGKCTVTYILSTLLTDLNVFVFCFFIKDGPELVISLLFNIFKCVIKGPNTSGWNYKMY